MREQCIQRERVLPWLRCNQNGVYIGQSVMGLFFGCAVFLAMPQPAQANQGAEQSANPLRWNSEFNTNINRELTPSGKLKRSSGTSGQMLPQNPEEVYLDPVKAPARTEMPIQSDGQNLWIGKIQIQGSTLLSEAEKRDLLTNQENRLHNLRSLNQLANHITEYYREQGYLTTEAYIPPQSLGQGNLTIQVREGRLGEIQLEGNRFYHARVIERQLDERPGALLNFRNLEAELNRINRRQSGYQVKAFLSAGKEPGETDIHLKMAERQPLQISPTWDNQGRYFTGLYRTGVELRHDSLFGLGDRLYVRGLLASGTRLGVASYSLPLNRYGTALNVSAALSKVDVMLPLDNPPSIVGRAASWEVSLNQPLTRSGNLQLETGFLWQRSTSFFEDFQTSRDQVYALQTALNWNKFDRWGTTFNRLQNTVAFRGAGSNTSFWKLENYFSRMLVLPKNQLVLLKAYGQWTPDALPGIQQFQIGGVYSVRGFTEGALIGDRGFNLGIEHRFPIPGLKYMSPWLAQRVQGAWFYDFGRVWRDRSNPAFNRATEHLAKTTLLQGVGFGFRAQLTQYLQGFVDVGFGLGNRKDIEPEHRQPTARVHVGVRSDFLPQELKMRHNLQRTANRL